MRALRKWFVVGAVVFCAAALSYVFLVDRPRESDRVTHPAGYSMIRPHDWVESIAPRSTNPIIKDLMRFEPKRWLGSVPSMWLTRYAQKPDPEKLKADGYQQMVFKDRPAWVLQRKVKKTYLREMEFEAGGWWFQFGVSLPGGESARIEHWWSYIDSFDAGNMSPRVASSSTNPLP